MSNSSKIVQYGVIGSIVGLGSVLLNKYLTSKPQPSAKPTAAAAPIEDYSDNKKVLKVILDRQ